MSVENCLIKNASEFSEKDKSKFKEIVLSMGEVSEQSFDGLMAKNPIILFYPNTTNIEAIGALKIPHLSYKTKVFKNSKSIYDLCDFQYELGWIVSLNQKKGIGKLITKALSDINLNIYSTVRTENIAMNKILKSLGFEKSGSEYKSERGNYYNSLYIKMQTMKYRRISASVLFDGPIFNEEGKVELSQTMRNKIYDKEEGFREKLIIEINNTAIGKWHIDFTEYPSGNFEADVYVENDTDYSTIRLILLREFKGNPLEYIWKKTFRSELFEIK